MKEFYMPPKSRVQEPRTPEIIKDNFILYRYHYTLKELEKQKIIELSDKKGTVGYLKRSNAYTTILTGHTSSQNTCLSIKDIARPNLSWHFAYDEEASNIIRTHIHEYQGIVGEPHVLTSEETINVAVFLGSLMNSELVDIDRALINDK